MRDSLVFYRSFYEAVRELPESDQASIYNALFAYALDGEEPQLSGVQAAIFRLMKPSIDSNNQKSENGCKGGEYGKLGGRPPKNPKKTPKKPQENPKETPYEDEDVYEDVSVDVAEDGFILADGTTYLLPPSRIAEFEKTFPEVNVKAELMRCRLKHNALSQRRNSVTIDQYIVRWLMNAQADAKKARPSCTDMEKHEEKLGDSFMRELAAKPGNLI